LIVTAAGREYDILLHIAARREIDRRGSERRAAQQDGLVRLPLPLILQVPAQAPIPTEYARYVYLVVFRDKTAQRRPPDRYKGVVRRVGRSVREYPKDFHFLITSH